MQSQNHAILVVCVGKKSVIFRCIAFFLGNFPLNNIESSLGSWALTGKRCLPGLLRRLMDFLGSISQR